MKLIIDIPNSLYANLKFIAEGTSACRRILECVKNGHRIEDHKMSDSRIKKIADFYGKESQLDILQEECAELVQAISKYRRGGSYKLTLEEIADVEIMIDQIKYLNTVAENKIIEKIKEGKLDRQIQRIIIQKEAEE